MPCDKHSDELEGRSDLECEACAADDKAIEAYWRKLYEGEKRAGLVRERDDPELPADPRTPEYWGI